LSRIQLNRTREYIEQNLGNELSLTELAAVAGLSPRHFALAFRQSTGTSPHKYVLTKRVAESTRLLATRQWSLAEIALTLGFASQSHFTEIFRKTLGTTPRRYQQGL
jgi:AraC family transcriptional regulator